MANKSNILSKSTIYKFEEVNPETSISKKVSNISTKKFKPDEKETTYNELDKLEFLNKSKQIDDYYQEMNGMNGVKFQAKNEFKN